MFKRRYDKEKIEPNPARDWRRLIYAFLVLAAGLFVAASIIMRGLDVGASVTGQTVVTPTSLDPDKLLNPDELERVLRELAARQAGFERQKSQPSVVVDPAR